MRVPREINRVRPSNARRYLIPLSRRRLLLPRDYIRLRATVFRADFGSEVNLRNDRPYFQQALYRAPIAQREFRSYRYQP